VAAALMMLGRKVLAYQAALVMIASCWLLLGTNYWLAFVPGHNIRTWWIAACAFALALGSTVVLAMLDAASRFYLWPMLASVAFCAGVPWIHALGLPTPAFLSLVGLLVAGIAALQVHAWRRKRDGERRIRLAANT
jgi:hypothetical protein